MTDRPRAVPDVSVPDSPLGLRITATVALAFPVIAVVAYGGIIMGIVTLIAIAFGLFVFLLADVVSRGGRVR